MYMYTRIFAFFIGLSSFLDVFFSLITPELPIITWHCQQAHSTAQGNQLAEVALGIIESLVAPNHGPLIFAPFAPSCILPCVRVAG